MFTNGEIAGRGVSHCSYHRFVLFVLLQIILLVPILAFAHPLYPHSRLSRQAESLASLAMIQPPAAINRQDYETGWQKGLSLLMRNTYLALIALVVLLLAGLAISLWYIMRQRRERVRQLAEMQCKLNNERAALERRIEERTSQLQEEVKERRRSEHLNRGRHTVLEQLTRGASMQGVLHALVETVADYHSVWGCAIHLCENGRLCLKASVDIPERLVGNLDILTQEQDGSPEQLAFSRGSAVVIHNLWKELKPWSKMLTAHNIQSAWSMPVRSVEGSVVGTLTVYSRLVHSPSEEEMNVLEMAAQMAALILNHRSLHDQLFNRAYHDSLTGIPNRRFGDDSLGKAIGLAQRKGKLLGVLWMDIDHFKQINDTHGHAAGDAVLQEVACRVKKRLRTSDTVARMGGDEFMIVLQELENPEDVIRVASDICEILSHPVAFGSQELPLQVSIGVSLYPNDGETTESLEICADHAMYRAKKEKLGVFCGVTTNCFCSTIGNPNATKPV